MEPIATILPRVNYGLAPRSRSCWVCKNVAAVEDVTMRLIDETGRELPYQDAIEYLTAIGHSAERRQWQARLKGHRTHVVRSMRTPAVYSPAAVETGQITRIVAPGGSASWIRAPDKAIDLGMEAMETLAGRISMMEDADLISVARLGITAAGKRGDWEAKGRQMGQMDALMKLASGFGGNNAR